MAKDISTAAASTVPLPTWPPIFLQLAIRAIKQIHTNYGLLEMGQSDLTTQNFVNLNTGNGVYVAPEEHVTDTICQQIVAMGLWRTHNINGEPRGFLTEREYHISFSKRKWAKVDILFKRKDAADTFFEPSLIEAKRFCLWKIDYTTGNATKSTVQKSDIEKDIKKLRKIYAHVQHRPLEIGTQEFKNPFLYLLVWGDQEDAKTKEEVIAKLKIGGDLLPDTCYFEIIPLSVDKDFKAIRFIWVALFEVSKPKIPSLCSVIASMTR